MRQRVSLTKALDADQGPRQIVRGQCACLRPGCLRALSVCWCWVCWIGRASLARARSPSTRAPSATKDKQRVHQESSYGCLLPRSQQMRRIRRRMFPPSPFEASLFWHGTSVAPPPPSASSVLIATFSSSLIRASIRSDSEAAPRIWSSFSRDAGRPIRCLFFSKQIN